MVDSQPAQVVKHLWDDFVSLDGSKVGNSIFGSYKPEQYKPLSKEEMLRLGVANCKHKSLKLQTSHF